jgi:serine/threonine-protein kinase HipA
MTLLDRRDGDAPASYLDIADVIVRRGAKPAADLEELWRRIVFFVCVSNVDDHLRNHGFLLTPEGWRLAPAYDVNPVPHGNGLLLNISETDNAQDLELTLATAASFRVKPKRAKEIIEDVVAIVRTWPTEAKKQKLSRAEQQRMASAFRVTDS